MFLSRPSRKGRPARRLTRHRRTRVSIHALAKRATFGTSTSWNEATASDQALAKRATTFGYAPMNFQWFLSTPSRRGRRPNLRHALWVALVSIHALAKRATRELGRFHGRERGRFYPRPREEGDSPRRSRPAIPWRFYPRPREEGDPPWTPLCGRQKGFYPRPREEGDAGVAGILRSIAAFLSTPSRRGRHHPLTAR